MKQLLLAILLCSRVTMPAIAQANQQQKEMLIQITALKTFLHYAKQGYRIVHTGVSSINRIKQGDFRLHNNQFELLKKINPAIGRYASSENTILLQTTIVRDCGLLLKQLNLFHELTAEERNYCRQIIQSILDNCIQLIDELTTVLLAGELELKDADRYKRLQKTVGQTQELFAALRSFHTDVKSLMDSRKNEGNSIIRSKQLNAIK
jgi:hypothetical protein